MKTKENNSGKSFFISIFLLVYSHLTLGADFLHTRSAEADMSYHPAGKRKRVGREIAEAIPTPEKKPLPVFEPAKKEEVIIVKEAVAPENYGQLNLSVLPSYMTVEGTQIQNNTKGILNSSMYASVQLDYKHIYHSWSIGLSGAYALTQFKHSVDHTLMNPTHALVDADLNVSKIFNRFSLGAGIGQDNKIFYKSINSTFIDIESRKVKRVYLQGEYQVSKSAHNKIATTLRVGINPAVDTETYDVKNGKTAGVQVNWDHFYTANKTVGLKIYYNHDEYQTQKLKLQSSEIGLGISFGYDWGSGK